MKTELFNAMDSCATLVFRIKDELAEYKKKPEELTEVELRFINARLEAVNGLIYSTICIVSAEVLKDKGGQPVQSEGEDGKFRPDAYQA